MTSRKIGLLAGAGSYILWGLSPLYFKAVASVEAFEVLSHRIVWSVLLLFGFLAWQKRLGSTFELFKDKKEMLRLFSSALLVSVNWLVYIYAVANGQTVDASMGYFINPILIIFLGMVFLGEKLNRFQVVALGLAILGIVYQVITLGSVSWISLVLPITFGLYGLVRKQSKAGSIQGLAIETLMMFPFALIYLFYMGGVGNLSFYPGTFNWQFLLFCAGLVTSVPLLLFTEGARRLPYSTMGFLQYFAPSLQFALGLFAFGEPFNQHKMISFMIIWLGLIVLVSAQVRSWILTPRKI